MSPARASRPGGVAAAAALLAAGVLLGATGCGDTASAAQAPAASPPRVTGRFDLMDMPTAAHPVSDVRQQPDGSCRATGGSRDLDTGRVVTLYGENGAVLATGRLGTGTPGTDEYACSFPFDLGRVAAKERRYGIEISHRGKAWVTAEVLAANGYRFTLALGGM